MAKKIAKKKPVTKPSTATEPSIMKRSLASLKNFSWKYLKPIPKGYANHPFRHTLAVASLILLSWGGCRGYRYLTRPVLDKSRPEIEIYEDSGEGKLVFDDKIDNLEVKIFNLYNGNGLYRIETRKTDGIVLNTERTIWSYLYDSKKGEVSDKARKEVRKMNFTSRTFSYDRKDNDPFTKTVFKSLDDNAKLIFNKAKIKTTSELEEQTNHFSQEIEELPQPQKLYSKSESFKRSETDPNLREIFSRPRDIRRPFNINTRYY